MTEAQIEMARAGNSFLAGVLDRIAGQPDGLAWPELLALYPARMEDMVAASVLLLTRQAKVVEVTRTHGTDEEHRDHSRLVVLRERGGA